MSAEPQHLTHPEPARRADANYLIQALVPDDPNTFEQLWVHKLGDDRFRVCCIPFFLYDVAMGDVVEWNDSDRMLRVVERSGSFVFRVWFDPGADQSSTIASLESMGALVERSSARLIALDAPDDATASALSGFLVQAGRRGDLVFETGRS